MQLIRAGDLMALGAVLAESEARWKPEPAPEKDAPMAEVLRWALRNARVGGPNRKRSLEYYASVGIDYLQHPHELLEELIAAVAIAMETRRADTPESESVAKP